MRKADVLNTMHRIGIVPVLRAASITEAIALGTAITKAGILTLEVTMTIPGGIDVIRHFKKTMPDLLLGAGTVLDAETARTCIHAGAQFIVSPASDLATIALCKSESIAVLPGALTPTEIVTAWRAGADVIKLFPASSIGGASYLRSIRAALPDIDFLPTGGISLENAETFLAAGAFALGVGSDLVNVNHSCEDVDNGVARKYMALIESARDYRSPARTKWS